MTAVPSCYTERMYEIVASILLLLWHLGCQDYLSAAVTAAALSAHFQVGICQTCPIISLYLNGRFSVYSSAVTLLR